MTNNEAAKWIQLYIDLAKIDPTTGEAAYLNDDARKTLEAMGMAINALTAQPEQRTEERTETHACDCISRKAAIDAAIDAVDEWDGGCSPTRADAITKALNALPPSPTPSRPQNPHIASRETLCDGCNFVGRCTYESNCPREAIWKAEHECDWYCADAERRTDE